MSDALRQGGAAREAASISMSYSFSPIEYILCDLSAIMGNFCEELLGAFYPRIISKRANVLITELVSNVLQNTTDPSSRMDLHIDINPERLLIRIKNVATPEQYEVVKSHVDLINQTEDLRELMRKTIRERRERRAKGGLGLIRVAAENKFNISVDYREGYLVVDSVLNVGGLL
ncbi:MAG: ATP-binding protein [Alphaproteobacteria bacterium]|nr:ATP-binding protein [Alphaproteobacteria bacterium]